MAPRFLPALRGRQTKALRRHGAGLPREEKAMLREYLAQVGVALSRERDWTFEQAVDEAYSRVVWCFRAVEIYAGKQSSLDFQLAEGKGDDAQIVDDHPLYGVLNGQANPMETGQQFRHRLGGQLLLGPKGAFVEVTLNNAQQLTRVDLLPPGRTRAVPGTGEDLIDHFEVTSIRGERRDIDVEKVRWFRNPNLADPYASATPLRAAGYSIELDHYARLYNRNFLQNDGRPGGILSVRSASKTRPGGIDPGDQKLLEARFAGRGPAYAGLLSVISGELNYVDTGSKPRDMAYEKVSSTAKLEILAAFGCPLALIDASGRTYDNSGQEGYNFWRHFFLPHLGLVAGGWHQDSEEGLYGGFDLSNVPELEWPKRQKREEAREEYEKGLRSLVSYARLAGYEDEIPDNALTRAFWVPAGRTPVALDPADADELAQLTAALNGGQLPGGPPAGEPPPGGGDETGGLAIGGPGDDPGGQPPREQAALSGRSPAPALPPGPVAAKSAGRLAAVPATRPAAAPPPRAAARARRTPAAAETKAAPESADPEGATSDTGEAARAALEKAVAAALAAAAAGLSARTAARLSGRNERKGTRHWQARTPAGPGAGTKALNTARIVQPDLWAAHAQAACWPLVLGAAAEAAGAMTADLGLGPVLDALENAHETKAILSRLGGIARRAVARAAAAVTALAGAGASSHGARLAADLAAADAAGADLDALLDIITAHEARHGPWSTALAVQVTTATLEGARGALAQLLTGDPPAKFTVTIPLTVTGPDWAALAADTTPVTLAGTGRPPGPGEPPAGGAAGPAAAVLPDLVARWLSRRDDRVRPTHVLADGQERFPGEPFHVGKAWLKHPGDPGGPPEETHGCRCRLQYRVLTSGKFTRTPPGAITRNPHRPGRKHLYLTAVPARLEGKAARWDEHEHPRNHGRFAHTPGRALPGPAAAPQPATAAAERLKAGALPDVVLGHLETSPDSEFTASGIAKATGRSAGAVANALARMETAGRVERTSDTPKRYRFIDPGDAAIARDRTGTVDALIAGGADPGEADRAWRSAYYRNLLAARAERAARGKAAGKAEAGTITAADPPAAGRGKTKTGPPARIRTAVAAAHQALGDGSDPETFAANVHDRDTHIAHGVSGDYGWKRAKAGYDEAAQELAQQQEDLDRGYAPSVIDAGGSMDEARYTEQTIEWLRTGIEHTTVKVEHYRELMATEENYWGESFDRALANQNRKRRGTIVAGRWGRDGGPTEQLDAKLAAVIKAGKAADAEARARADARAAREGATDEQLMAALSAANAADADAYTALSAAQDAGRTRAWERANPGVDFNVQRDVLRIRMRAATGKLDEYDGHADRYHEFVRGYYDIEHDPQDPQVQAAAAAAAATAAVATAARLAHRAAAKRRRQVLAEARREVLAEIRPLGSATPAPLTWADPPEGIRGTADSSNRASVDGKLIATAADITPELRAQITAGIDAARACYPADWNARIDARGALNATYVRRGFANQDGTIALSHDTAPWEGAPGLQRIAVHEYGHHAEFALPELRALEYAYHWKRTTRRKAGNRIRDGKNAIVPIEGLGQEVGSKDEFGHHYVGKVYKDDADSSWELFSMSAESLFAGSAYLDDDPETAAWAMGVLATVGVPPPAKPATGA